MTARKLAVVSGGLSQPSSTRLLADRLTEATVDRLREQSVETEVVVIELRDLAHDVTNNLLTGFASPKLQNALDAVTNADGLIAVTPIFTTSYSGLFKSFIDIIDTAALAELPVLIGATGGTERHSLALDYAMRAVHLPARDRRANRCVRCVGRLGERKRSAWSYRTCCRRARGAGTRLGALNPGA
ncbi:MAG: NADPH-dependent reductase [Glaciihabitans sp.]|nr:NADPH-dependent reductase [Glaciihabitans sp.]